MNNKINKYVQKYLDEVNKRKAGGERVAGEIKRVKMGGNVKRLIERFEKPAVGVLPRSRMVNVGTVYIPTNVITCLDDICRKEYERYNKK